MARAEAAYYREYRKRPAVIARKAARKAAELIAAKAYYHSPKQKAKRTDPAWQSRKSAYLRGYMARLTTERRASLRERAAARLTAKLYGIPLQHALELRREPACAVCKVALTSGNGSAGRHIDHDHVTGIIRGVLCRACNVTLGAALESTKRLRALATYIEANAMVIRAVA